MLPPWTRTGRLAAERHAVTNETGPIRILTHIRTEREQDQIAGLCPDGDFPVVYAEKGFLWADWTMTVHPSGGPVRLLSLEGGSAPNVVPDRAEAMLEAEWPEEVAAALDRARIDGDGGEVVRSLNATFNRALYGEIVGLPTPGVSVSPGSCRVENGTARLVPDVPFPRPVTDEEVWSALNLSAVARGWEARLIDRLPLLRVEPDGPLVRSLLEVFRAESGMKDVVPRSVGFTTYAKSLPNTVAFGPLMPGPPDTSHEPDESIGVADRAFQARCYARAIQALAGEGAGGVVRPVRSP